MFFWALSNGGEKIFDFTIHLKKQFRIIANKFINSVEISAQEATYLLLQLPLKRSSRQVFFLNTSPPKDRIFLLKPQHVIDSLQDEDPNIKVDSIVDKYEARPQNLENVSFAEFASNYEEIKQPIYSRSKWKNASDGLLHEHFDAVDNADDTDDADDSAASAAAAVVVVVYGPTSEISSLTVLDVAVALAERGPCEQDGGEWVICKNV